MVPRIYRINAANQKIPKHIKNPFARVLLDLHEQVRKTVLITVNSAPMNNNIVAESIFSKLNPKRKQ